MKARSSLKKRKLKRACGAITTTSVGLTEIPSHANPWFSESEGRKMEWERVVFYDRNAKKVAKGRIKFPIKIVVGQRTHS
jgi:hypothetical protein